MKQKGDIFFTYLSTSIVKLVTWCLSPETKILKWFLMLSGGMRRDSLNSVVTWMQKAPQRVPVHVSSAEQQQKLSGIGNKMTDSAPSAFPSVEDLKNAGPSLLIFLLRLLTVISTKC